MSVELRKQTYRIFAEAANDASIRWVVLHGIEGYPNKIGRDLDVTAINLKDTSRLLDVFASVLHRESFRSIVHTSPIWGRRILGITEDYNVVELHTIERVRFANVEFKPDWNAVEYVEGLFPVERFVSFCKSCLMPAIAGDRSWRRKCNGVPEPTRVPWWSRRVIKQAQALNEVTSISIATLCGGYLLAHPLVSTENSYRWLRTKIMAQFQPTAPVYSLPKWIEQQEFESIVKQRLGELFLDVVCGDKISQLDIRYRQSRQQLVYLTQGAVNKLAAVEIGPGRLSPDELLEFLVTSFCKFNERWHP